MEVQWDTCPHQVPDIDIENWRGGGEGLGPGGRASGGDGPEGRNEGERTNM